MEVATLLALLVASVAAYLVWYARTVATMRGRGGGPRMWPLVGSLPGLIQNAERMHEWIADNLRSSGGTYQTCICAVPGLARRQGMVTVTCDPRNLEHVLKTRFDNYPKGPNWHAVFKDLLGDGIFNSDGDTWLLQRKTAALEFTTRTLRQAMSRWVSRAIQLRLLPILRSAADAGGAASFDLQDLLLRLTFDNICGLAFGKDPETLAPGLPENAFATAFDRATEASLNRFILPEVVWRLKKWLRLGMEATLCSSVEHVDDYLSNVIKARKLELHGAGGDHDDLLSRFMRKGDYSDEFLQHVALNFILAGRDTSSVALSWFFWLVSLHRDVEENILREVCAVLADTRGGGDTAKWLATPLDFEEIDRLVYLKAALSETLRLYPSVPEDSKHVVANDVLPDGTFVPAGSSVTYSIYSTGRMKSIWGEDCLEFKPERWLTADRTRFAPHDSFKFVAFNGGPRICLGKDLAYLQMKSIAAAVLLRHHLTVAPGHRVVQKMSLTLFMKYGLRMNASHRDLAPIAAELQRLRMAAAAVVAVPVRPEAAEEETPAANMQVAHAAAAVPVACA